MKNKSAAPRITAFPQIFAGEVRRIFFNVEGVPIGFVEQSRDGLLRGLGWTRPAKTIEAAAKRLLDDGIRDARAQVQQLTALRARLAKANKEDMSTKELR